MAQFKGDVQFVSSLTFEAKKPLDARELVDLKQDLFSESYSTYLHKGIKVSVVNDTAENNGVYILLGDNSKLEASWVRLASKESVDNITKIVTGAGIQLSSINPTTHEQTVSVKLKAGANLAGVTTTDGILVSGDLKYTSNTGKLVIVDSSGNEIGGGVSLPLTQIIVPEKCRYDTTTEELVIVFGDASGNETEVRIPASDLITEWTTKNTNSISLTRTRVVDGVDELTADLKLKSTVNGEIPNAIKVDSNGVYVEDKTQEINTLRNNVVDIEEVVSVAITDHENKLNSLLIGDNSVDSKIEKAKEELLGTATDANNTLGKLEDSINSIINDSADPDSTNESYSVGKVNELFSELKIQDAIDGNATTVTVNSSSHTLKVDVNVDNKGIIVNSSGILELNIIDGGTF